MAEETVLTPPADNQTTEISTPASTASDKPAEGAKDPAVSDWRLSLPADLRSEKMFENIKGKDASEALPALAKGYRDAQKLVGSSMGKLPGKGASEAEIKTWKDQNVKKLQDAGLIDAPPADGKYTAKIIRDGEPMSVPEGTYDELNKEFSALGLTDKQAQGVLDLYSRSTDKIGGTVKDTMKVLREEWGAGAEMQIKAAQQAVREVGGSELIDVLEQTGLGNHPALIKTFAKIGAIIGEDDAVFRDTVRTGSDEAESKIAAIKADKKHAYWVREDPGHKAAVEEMSKLYQIVQAHKG